MRILIVEDSDVGKPLKRYIERMFAPGQAEVTIFTSLEGVPAFVAKNRPETILLDLGLPEVSIDTIIEEFIPVFAAVSDVMVCSSHSESLVLRRCILAGANTYIRKDELFADGMDRTVTKFRSMVESSYYRAVRDKGLHSKAPVIPFPNGMKESLTDQPS